MQKLDASDVCDRISVHEPYFAFRGLEKLGSHAVCGSFSPEHERGYERGPVSAAELLRHLAILGSCAAAVDVPESNYYLASRATLTIHHEASKETATRELHAQAEVVSQDRRSLATHSRVESANYRATFRCEYQVLPKSIFDRTFRKFRKESAQFIGESPYGIPVDLEFDAPKNHSLIARSGPIDHRRFAGHFLDCPAWPASVFAESTVRTVERLLHHILGDTASYSITRLDGEAYRLVPATESVSFHVTCIGSMALSQRYWFSTQVMRGDDVVAAFEMDVTTG